MTTERRFGNPQLISTSGSEDAEDAPWYDVALPDKCRGASKSFVDRRVQARIKRRAFTATSSSQQKSIYDSRLGMDIQDMQTALECHLEDLHHTVIRPVESLGWYGAALYLVDAGNGALEAAAATDATVPGVIRHRLPRIWGDGAVVADWGPYDIEVCTFLSKRATRITGGRPDPRYNPYVYETLGHSRFVDRLFVPLVLVRDRQDYSIHQHLCEWRHDDRGWIPYAGNYQLQAVGTLSVSSLTPVPENLIVTTLEFATQIAASIAYRASMHGLCEALLSVITRRSGADSSSLVFVDQTERATSPVRTGLVFERGAGVTFKPVDQEEPRCAHSTMVMSEALQLGLPVRVATQDVESGARVSNCSELPVTDEFPVIGAEGRCIGLLSLAFRSPDQPETPTDLFDLVTTASHVIDVALRADQRMSLVRDRAVAEAVKFSSSSMEGPQKRASAMASFAWSLLGCDHVAIAFGGTNTVLSVSERVVEVAGRYLDPESDPEDLKREILDIRAPLGAVFEIGNLANGPYARQTFAAREAIEATAVVPLRSNYGSGQVVGLMIVDYRGDHEFTTAEKELIERLAGFFAAGVLMLEQPDKYISLLFAEASRLQRKTFLARPVTSSFAYRN